jgi:aconitate hydratase
MSVWSNIAECARFMFRRLDPEFHGRAQRLGGGAIVAGHNYGQGSSREHAALAPLHLGVRAILARSYARIHRRNLIAVGIVPLLLPDDAHAEQGEHLSVPGLLDALRSDADTVNARIGGRPVPLGLQLTAGERAVLLSGGLISHIREGRRSPVHDTV